jgi:hypothetical protein
MKINSQSYIGGTEENQSYTILQMTLATIKRMVVEMNTVANLPKKDEKAMINLGVKVAKGKESSELYAKKLISIVEKITKKKIKKEDKNHLKRRIQGYIRKDFSENKLSHLSLLIEKLEKVTNKEVLLFAK